MEFIKKRLIDILFFLFNLGAFLLAVVILLLNNFMYSGNIWINFEFLIISFISLVGFYIWRKER
ncbi:MAG: hypothetical protein BAJALOKI2v1_180015 [Promethearchaeota archaeon]|nr:MAG: hypothetical protein BAJALOKI2v1_180015 [Candidatus Lokiarchaeota archaeon]